MTKIARRHRGPRKDRGFAVTHFSPGAGFVAKGSVLLASLPPWSLYAIPAVVILGSLLCIHASAHTIHVLSKHIASLPGDPGSSGTLVGALTEHHRHGVTSYVTWRRGEE